MGDEENPKKKIQKQSQTNTPKSNEVSFFPHTGWTLTGVCLLKPWWGRVIFWGTDAEASRTDKIDRHPC